MVSAMKIVEGSTQAAWLASLELGYLCFLVILLVCTLLGLAALVLGWGSSGRARLWLARAALAGMTTLVGILVAEGVVGVYLAWIHRLPRLAMVDAAPRPTANGEDVNILVVGESSAEGVPYRDWLSVGKIVAWQLRRLF